MCVCVQRKPSVRSNNYWTIINSLRFQYVGENRYVQRVRFIIIIIITFFDTRRPPCIDNAINRGHGADGKVDDARTRRLRSKNGYIIATVAFLLPPHARLLKTCTGSIACATTGGRPRRREIAAREESVRLWLSRCDGWLEKRRLPPRPRNWTPGRAPGVPWKTSRAREIQRSLRCTRAPTDVCLSGRRAGRRTRVFVNERVSCENTIPC